MPEKTNEKISVQEMRVEKITEHHSALLGKFNTSNKELKDFLVEDAIRNQKMALSTTYLWFYNPTNELISYVTILTDAIRIHGTMWHKQFTDKGVNYKTLPAIKIGRMCVADNFQKKGIGSSILLFVMEKLLSLNEDFGCRFIVVEAKKEAINFYKKKGFQVLKDKEKGILPMIYDMLRIIEIFRENKGKLKLSSISEKK